MVKPTMGFNTIENDGQGGYSLFDDGDNVLAKLSKIECDVSTYQGEFQGYELELRFDALEEVDEERDGMIPYWPNSKITVADTEQHTSNLAKLLEVAGVTRDVLEELGADSDTVDAVLRGDTNFEAESVDENQALAQAVLKHVAGKVFRVSSKQRVDSDGEATYSQVDRVLGLKDDKKDVFDSFDCGIDLDHPSHDDGSDSVDESDDSMSDSESDDSEEEDDEDQEDQDVIFGNNDEDEDVEGDESGKE